MPVVKVRLDGGDQVITSSITRDAVADLGLTEGSAVTVLAKSTEASLASSETGRERPARPKVTPLERPV